MLQCTLKFSQEPMINFQNASSMEVCFSTIMALSGGSIYVQGRSMDIRDSSFKTCNAGIGGAIRIYMANMRVKQCLFENNVSPLGGSINIEHFSTLLMEKTVQL